MFIERFVHYLKYEKRFSPHTVSAYQNDLDQFHHFIKESELNAIDVKHQHVRSWIVELLDKKTESKTINRKLSTIRSFYKFLLKEELLESNPTLLVKSPKIPKRLPVIIEETKINALLDNEILFSDDFESIRDHLVIELLFGTGIRLAELISLQQTDVNFYEATITVLGKRSKQRIIPLNDQLLNSLKIYVDRKKNKNYNNNSSSLFVTKEGNPVYPKFIYRIVKKYLSHITTQDKKSPHIMRHSFATSLLNNGADINAIKELLGHASLAATQVYTHNSVERLKTIYKQAHPKA